MDSRIEKIFNHWLHFQHKVWEFEWLFNEEKSNVELRNELLPDFFYDLNQIYWESMLMSVSRLLDNYKQGQNINLSLFTLVEILKENEKSEWREVEAKLKELKAKHKSIVKYRQKYLAHNDLEYAIGNKQLGTSTHIADVHVFLSRMHDVLNDTLRALGYPEKSKGIITRGRYRGALELMNILRSEKQRRSSD